MTSMFVIETPSLSVVYDTADLDHDVNAILGEDPWGSIYGLCPLGLRWLSVGGKVLDSFELEIDGPNGDIYMAGFLFGFRAEMLFSQLDASGRGTCEYGEGGSITAHLEGEDLLLALGRGGKPYRGPYATFRADILSVLYHIAAFFEQRDRRCVDVDNEVGLLLRDWLKYRPEAPEPALE